MFCPRIIFRVLGLLALLAAVGVAVADDKKPRTDAFGDPLPDGATARLGTSRWRHEGKVTFVAFAAGGKYAVTSCGQGIMHVWDAKTGQVVRTFGDRIKVESSGSGYYVNDPWDDEYDPSPRNMCQMAVSREGEAVAIAGPDRQIHVWNMTTGKEMYTVKSEQKLESGFAMNFTDDGKSLLIRTRSGAVRVWDIEKQEFTARYGDSGGSGGGSGSGPGSGYYDYDYGRRKAPAVVSPDGKTVAIVSATFSYGSFRSGEDVPDNPDKSTWELRLVELKSGKELQKIKVPIDGRAYAMEMIAPVFSSDGKRVACGPSSGPIRVFDVGTGKEQKKLEVPSESDGSGQTRGISRVMFAPDGKTVAMLAWNDKIHLYEAESGKELRDFGGEKVEEEARPDRRFGKGSRVASGGGYYSMSFATESMSIAWSPDGKTMAQAQGRLLRLWNVETGKGNDLSGGHLGEVSGVVVAADGKTAVTIGTDRTVRQWDVVGAKEQKKSTLPGKAVQCQLVAPAAALVVGQDMSLELWDPIADKFEPGLGGFGDEGFRGFRGPAVCAMSTNRRTLARAEADVIIRSFNAERNAENRLILTRDLSIQGLTADEHICGMACAPDGRTLAIRVDQGGDRFRRRYSGEPDEAVKIKAIIRLYGVDHGNTIWERATGAPNCNALAFSPNGSTIALIGGTGDAVSLLEAATGKERARYKTDAVALTYSSDGLFLGLGTQDGAVKVVDARDGKEVASFQGHNGKVTSLAFSADASTLLSSSADGSVLVWDTAQQTAKARPRPAITDGKAKELWESLGGETDATYQAVVALSASPTQAVSMLKDHLKPAKMMDEAQLDKLIAELDGDTFEGRQKALRELGRTGDRFQRIFEDALDNDPAPEARKNLEQLLAWLEPGNIMPDVVRDIRAIEVLETIATPEARSLLEGLAKGARGSPLTRESAAALRRMGKGSN